jgi:glycosyltransferase involved in cell wall biosynthesis
MYFCRLLLQLMRSPESPMRILTFTSLFPNKMNPDFGIFIFQRTSHLARLEGNVVEVIAPVPYVPALLKGTVRGSMASSIPRIEDIGDLQVHHPRYLLAPKVSMPFHGFLMYAGCLRYVKRLHQEYPFDCIDAHYMFPDGLAAVLLGKSLGIPVVVSARGTDIHTFHDFATVRPQIQWTIRHAATVIAVSDSLVRIMLDLVPSLKDVRTIGNGVDSERFFPEDQGAAREKLRLDPGDRIIVSVAALKHVKGPDLLVRAAALLKKSFVRCKVLFVGAGAELASLQKLALQLDCADICQFVGPVPNEQLRTYYSAADASCLASRNEGWPNVILESLACGTPVVATGVGEVPRLLADPELGTIVAPTPEAIHAGLLRALQRQWNRETLSAYAQQHTWENVAARVEAVLKEATGQTDS